MEITRIRKGGVDYDIRYLINEVTITDTGEALEQTLLPNTLYIFPNRVSNLPLSLASGDEGKANEYHLIIQFATPNEGETIPTITWPSGLLWATGFTPTFEGGATYEISILNGTAMFNEAKAPVTQS